MGIETVAVYSDADADAPHVADATLAVRLPGDAPSETYLKGDLIVAAALRAGADALHPGYGFLAGNKDFATAVVDAGLTWVRHPGKGDRGHGIQSGRQGAARRGGCADVAILDRRGPGASTFRCS